MRPRVHVVGAGVAGLAAAVAAARLGTEVHLYEAAPGAGGRCRTVRPADGFHHDNGTHVLFTGNDRALGLIEACGARSRWIEPEPDGFPLWDAAEGRLTRIGLSPWSWIRPGLRPPGLGPRALARLTALILAPGDRTVAAVAGDGPFTRALVEPLTVAVLNTPVGAASARRLSFALRRLSRPGAARLLVAANGLDDGLVSPALALLRRHGAAIRFGARLRALELDGEGAAALAFGDAQVQLRPDDRVVLAVPPWEAARLLPGTPVPEAYEAILNVHYRLAGPARPRFVGFLGSLAQWALLRSDHASVTVSAAGDAADEPPPDIAARVWAEIAPALRALGMQAGPQPEARVVKERRATPRQAAGGAVFEGTAGHRNVALVGDWIGPLPATIESAIVSGEVAAALLLGGWRGARFPVAALCPAPEASR